MTNENEHEPNEDGHLESAFEEQTHVADDDRGWPGDGSGTDDLADHNSNEANDYLDEGREDGFDEPSGCLGDE